ncbi:MAG: DUF3108 domain-containing protein [Hyphomicrobium sp.]
MLKNLAIFTVAAASAIVGASAGQAADASWPETVSARYKLYFNGFDVGSYRFESRFNGKVYDATSNANVSALFGAFKWKGDIKGEGAADAVRPRPVGYKLTFKTKSKKGSVELGFNAGSVASVDLQPDKSPSSEAVPLEPEHYKNVFDPMSAILAITRSANKNPCEKRIPIFDGKVRFDLLMSYKMEQPIADAAPSGQPERLVVCRVKYAPIAGHKPKDFENPWVDYNAIEIALRPIPSANIFVPYRVTIPTTLGSAVMMAETVDITTAGHAQIALKQKTE